MPIKEKPSRFAAMPVEPAPMADEFSLEGVQLAAGPGTRTDAPANVGRAKAPTRI